MARRDGEDWLEGRPFGSGPAPAEREEARSRLRDWRWWATIASVAVVIGAASEGLQALFGGGDLSLAGVLNTAIGASVGLVFATWFVARDDRR